MNVTIRSNINNIVTEEQISNQCLTRLYDYIGLEGIGIDSRIDLTPEEPNSSIVFTKTCLGYNSHVVEVWIPHIILDNRKEIFSKNLPTEQTPNEYHVLHGKLVFSDNGTKISIITHPDKFERISKISTDVEIIEYVNKQYTDSKKICRHIYWYRNNPQP